MPQLGSDKNPIIMNSSGKQSTRVLGLLGKSYSGESKKKYDENYDRIFKKKSKVGEKNA